MPRKKAAEIEILPPEDDQQPRGRKKLVEAEHTIKYSAPVPVTVETDPEEDDQVFEDDPIDVEKKRKRKTAKTERDELRKKLMNHGVTAASTLKLIIERYVHSDGPDSGTTAEKSHCTKYGCDEAHVLNQDYMDVAAKWGAGRYWFTLYKDGTIVSQWEKRLEPSRQTPIIQRVNPNDPNSPQVIVQMPEGMGAQQPVSVIDPIKQMRETAKMYRELKEAFEPNGVQHSQQPKDEDEVIANAIIKHPAVIETVVESIVKRVGGKSGGDSDAPWFADIIKDSITTGQLAPTVQGVVKALFPNGLFGGLFPGGQNNGQAQMAQTQFSQSQPPGAETNNHPQAGQETLAGNQSSLQPATITDGQSDSANTQTTQQITPEQHALSRLIQNCQRNVPVQVAYQQLVSYADAIEEQAPDYSIYGYIDLLGSMTTDQVLEFVKALPRGETVIALPHCREWCEGLQKLIQESQEGGEE